MAYSDLQSDIADELNRTDLTTAIKRFITRAEARLNRDPLVRDLVVNTSFSVSADGDALPSDVRTVQSMYLDGPTYFGPVETVDGGRIGLLKSKYNTAGVPRFVAFLNGAVYFAPEPDATYSYTLTYFRRIPTLSDAAPTNWFLDDHPDLYLYASVVEGGIFLRDPEIVQTYEALLRERLVDLARSAEQEQFGGDLLRRPFKPIGG